MNNTLFITIQSLLLIFITHFLIKNNISRSDNIYSKIDTETEIDTETDTETDTEIDIEDNMTDLDAKEKENININIQQIPNKDNINSTLETFNADSLKQDLENYLNKQTISNPISNPNLVVHKPSDFDDDTKLESYFKLNENSENKYLSKDVKEETSKNRIDYEEWVYNDETTMNGKELYDGIHAYDDMENSFAYFDNKPIKK